MTAPVHRVAVLGGGLAALLLLAAAPTPAVAVRELREPAAGADPTAPVVALLSLLAWPLIGWLLLTVALTVGSHLPGRLGRLSVTVVRRLAPVAVRRGIELTLGVTVVVSVVGAAPATAAPGSPTGPPAAAGLDWAAAPVPPAADLDWAAGPSSDVRPADEVVVAPGDSLWELAERDLTARSGGEPSDAEVAQAWPAWWAANREVVGEDPHLIQPGTRLAPPPSDSPASS